MNNKYTKICMWIFFGLMVAINGFIVFQACLPEGSSESWSNPVAEVIGNISGGSVNPDTVITPGLTFGLLIRKIIGHFALFGIDGIITYLFFYFLNKEVKLPKPYLYLIFALLVGIIIPVLTEVIQLFVPGRVGDFVDVFIDIGGFVLFGGVAFLVTYLINRHHEKKQLNNI